MATKAQVNAVYAAGLIQGITLVTFPAASTIFTDPSQYGLSNTQYGTMFLPPQMELIPGPPLPRTDVARHPPRGAVRPHRTHGAIPLPG
jgi:hypothetical protein